MNVHVVEVEEKLQNEIHAEKRKVEKSILMLWMLSKPSYSISDQITAADIKIQTN